jgi:hypothetical protein
VDPNGAAPGGQNAPQGAPNQPPPPPGGGATPPNPFSRAARRERMEQELRALTGPQREALMKVNRMVVYFGLLALGAMITLSLSLPWPAVGMALLVAATVVGIVAIRKASSVPLARGAVLYLALGLGLVGMFAIYAFGLILTWGPQWEYQRCLNDAQTVQGQDACAAEFKNSTQNLWTGLLGQ